ncbi:transcription factor TFIIIC subunit tfc4 [Tulasnella sp. 427]|nr:transcription factor TFIIIC subunit tfc4 [Tulasnella sp. 427]
MAQVPIPEPSLGAIPIVGSLQALREWRVTAFDTRQSVGFIPTMGALHDGHLSLVRRSLQENDLTIVSIFVNPAQFAPHEDLATYPRTLPTDIAALSTVVETVTGRDGDQLIRSPSAVFVPAVKDMYPSGIVQSVEEQKGTFVEVKGFSHQMEGQSRPTFFRGVATVVTKLFNAVQPTNAYFGQKDIQQACLLRRMVRDLLIPHPTAENLHIVPTHRHEDGLAMSSRNTYLTPPERAVAITLFNALSEVQRAWDEGFSRSEALVRANALVNGAISASVAAGVTMRMDYIEMNDPETFEVVKDNAKKSDGKPVILSGALWVGKTRLIDNILLDDIDDVIHSDESELSSEENEQVLPVLGASGQDRGVTLNTEELEEAQGEIAGDFERLIKNLGTSDVNGPRGSAPSIWNLSIDEAEDYVPEEDLEEEKGPKKRGRKKGQRLGVELSHQVKAMIGEAATAYINRDLDKAMEICQEVIRIEPSAYSAWNTLALVHEDRENFEAALKLKIMAAHLQGDAELWRELGRASRESGQMQQGLYCFRKAVSLDPRDVDAIWDRSVMLRETGQLRAAMSGFLSILKVAPYHMGVLLQLGPIFSLLSEFHRGIALYTGSLEYYQAAMPDGPVGGEDADCIMLLITLADFCNTVGEYEQAIRAIRDGARWIQGRGSQRYWSSATDDREYDVQGSERPAGSDDSAGRPQGFFAIDPNLRHRLALARLGLGDLDEGQMHGSIVQTMDAREYASLFTELGGAYFDRGLYAAALRIYEELASYEETSNIGILMRISSCHRLLGDFDKAVEVLKYVLEVNPENIEAKMRLAELYEILDQPRQALALVNEGKEPLIAWRKTQEKGRSTAGDEDPESSSAEQSGALFEEKKRHAKSKSTVPIGTIHVFELARQNVVDEGFSKLEKLDPKGPERTEWMKEALVLIDVFRETRELFSGNRFARFQGSINERRLRRMAKANDATAAATDMASRLQIDISMYEAADEILRHILFSNAYATFAHQTSIRLALLACATVQRDYSCILEHARRLIFTHQFNNEPLRLYLACMGGGLHSVDTFIDTKHQKALRREIDYYKLITDGEDPRWVGPRNRWVFNEKGGKQDEDESLDEEQEEGATGAKRKSKVPTAIVGANPSPSKATKDSPILLALYGQLSSCAKSYQSALFYLYQAYDLQPDDPIICLCLAVASASRAMQRQSDNRHHMIAQAFAFLQRYKEIRKEDHVEEVEYNLGRLFHQLGLLSLASKHYERVLQHAQDNPLNDPGSLQGDCV